VDGVAQFPNQRDESGEPVTQATIEDFVDTEAFRPLR
jgi:hypothetical protein